MSDPEQHGELLKRTSIVICTVDRLPELESCLDSLAPFKPFVADIVVVNNGPRRTEVEELARRRGVQVVDEPRRGVSHARNAGIRAVTGNIIAFLDDDSVADPGWLPVLVQPLHHPDIFAVVGSIAAQTLEHPVSQVFDELHRAQFPESPTIFTINDSPHEFPMRKALVGNANMAIRREAFQRFGYFDARFGRGTRVGSGEEPDFLLRVLLGGGKIAVEVAARILHRHSTDWDSVRRWAFTSGCAHTAILTKYFFREPSLRGQILRYAVSRVGPQRDSAVSSQARSSLPRAPFLLGSLYGPLAYSISGRE